ncbi:MAG: hypothetical protein RDU47_10880, partial [Spirochaetia bacterium]|nr:hypothetical protein [Spirochaetia bacterium]
LEELCTTARSLGTIRDIGQTQVQKIYEKSLQRLARQESGVGYSSKVEYATAEERKVPYSKSFLQTEQDVEEYAAVLTSKWKELVRKGKRIEL